MLLLGGSSCAETPQVGHGKGTGEPGVGLAREATGTGTSFALAETASSGSFDLGCSIRFRLLEHSGRSSSRYRVKRIQRLSAAARFSQPAHGLIPIP
jgi:hypothetical protein